MVPQSVPGVPGAPEPLIGLVMLAFYIAIPVLAMVAVYDFLDGRRGYERRISRLEDRVEELENERR